MKNSDHEIEKISKEFERKYCNELIDEPIRIAEKLIYAIQPRAVSQKQKALWPKSEVADASVYTKSDLCQIAKHLLAYCDNENME